MRHLIANQPYIQKSERNGYEKLVVFVAKAYLILLPIRMIHPLLFLQQYFRATAECFDLVLHILGLILIIAGSKGVIRVGRDRTARLFQFFVLMVVWFNLSSVIMAIIMQYRYGNIGTESAFAGISGMLVYFTQYVFIIFYNKEIFKKISKEEVVKIFKFIVGYLFVIGYLQIAVMNLGGAFSMIYDKLDVLDVLCDSNKLPKLSLTGSEGASAGVLVGTLVFPFIMSQIFVHKRTAKYYLFLLLWLPIVYFTYSTTAYISVAVNIAVFCWVYLFKAKHRLKSMVLGVSFSLMMLGLLAFPASLGNVLPGGVSDNIEYLLMEKAVDKANGSTISRIIPLYVNWGAFTEFPILGVGNGNQGYFYEKHFPDFAYNVAGSDATVFLERSKTGISNGGVFFPSLLSGYGVVGIVLVLIYVGKCLHYVKQNRDKMGSFYYMFYLSWIAILVAGFQGDFVGNYYLWFLLSIPFMAHTKTNQTTRIQVEK